MKRIRPMGVALNPREANHADYALRFAKNCQCATCVGVKLAFAMGEDTTLRIEIREERQPARFTWKDYPEIRRHAA